MRFIDLLALSIWLLTGLPANAVTVGISGANSTSSFSLETHKRTTLSANVAVEVASFMYVGLTHRRSYEEKDGLKRNQVSETEYQYDEFEDDTEIVTNSLDLSLFLHQGVISPFVFGGVAHRQYVTEVRYRGTIAKSRTTLSPVPNYGFGVSLMLNREFSVKITQTYTPGERTTLESGVEVDEDVIDNYTQIGVSYRL